MSKSIVVAGDDRTVGRPKSGGATAGHRQLGVGRAAEGDDRVTTLSTQLRDAPVEVHGSGRAVKGLVGAPGRRARGVGLRSGHDEAEHDVARRVCGGVLEGDGWRERGVDIGGEPGSLLSTQACPQALLGLRLTKDDEGSGANRDDGYQRDQKPPRR
jgi:hypothetical protein